MTKDHWQEAIEAEEVLTADQPQQGAEGLPQPASFNILMIPLDNSRDAIVYEEVPAYQLQGNVLVVVEGGTQHCHNVDHFYQVDIVPLYEGVGVES
jgi:hypothetical protein